MTHIEIAEAALIEISRAQREAMEYTRTRRFLMLIDAGLSAGEAERILSEGKDERKAAA